MRAEQASDGTTRVQLSAVLARRVCRQGGKERERRRRLVGAHSCARRARPPRRALASLASPPGQPSAQASDVRTARTATAPLPPLTRSNCPPSPADSPPLPSRPFKPCALDPAFRLLPALLAHLCPAHRGTFAHSERIIPPRGPQRDERGWWSEDGSVCLAPRSRAAGHGRPARTSAAGTGRDVARVARVAGWLGRARDGALARLSHDHFPQRPPR